MRGLLLGTKGVPESSGCVCVYMLLMFIPIQTYVHKHIFLLMDLALALPEGTRVSLLVPSVLVSTLYVCDLCGWLCINVYRSCICILCVPIGAISSALQLTGPEHMGVQQPHLLWVVKSHRICFPLTAGI